jgi:hypothetical protein
MDYWVRRYSAISTRSRVARGVNRNLTDRSGGRRPRLRQPWQIAPLCLSQPFKHCRRR